jgi:hypothetical protein
MIRKPHFRTVFKREPNVSCIKLYVLHALLLQWNFACGSYVYLLCWCLISKYNTYSWMPKVRWFWRTYKLESLQDSSGLIHSMCHLNARCTWSLHLIESILFSVNNANEPYVWLLEPLLLSIIQTMLLRSATYLLHLLWIIDFCSRSCDVSYISDLFSSLPCHKHSGILFQWGLTSPSVRILFPLFALQGYYMKEDFVHNKGLCVLACYIQASHSTPKSISAP